MKTKAKWGWRKLLGFAMAAIIIFGVSMNMAHKAGSEAGTLARERLELVWPSLMAMPEADRALIVGLAMSCRMEQRPAEPREVVACLREAAADPHAILPKDVDQASAQSRLEQLLQRQI